MLGSNLFSLSFCVMAYFSQRRRALDWLIHIWARLSLKIPNLLLFGSPAVYGLQNLPPVDEAVVYVPNHTTFFDILLLSGIMLPCPSIFFACMCIHNVGSRFYTIWNLYYFSILACKLATYLLYFFLLLQVTYHGHSNMCPRSKSARYQSYVPTKILYHIAASHGA